MVKSGEGFTETLLSKSDRTNGVNFCWPWLEYKDRDGYGLINIDGKTRRAHRVSFELAHGVISNGMEICHSCDNPSCINPAHLYEGTQKDNIHDAMAKGRLDHSVVGALGAVFNSSKTYCVHGHLYDPENTYVNHKGYRSCRACTRKRNRELNKIYRATHKSEMTMYMRAYRLRRKQNTGVL